MDHRNDSVSRLEWDNYPCSPEYAPTLCSPEYAPTLCSPEDAPTLCSPEYAPTLCSPEDAPTLCSPEYAPTLDRQLFLSCEVWLQLVIVFDWVRPCRGDESTDSRQQRIFVCQLLDYPHIDGRWITELELANDLCWHWYLSWQLWQWQATYCVIPQFVTWLVLERVVVRTQR